jgi:hypothetical protein
MITSLVLSNDSENIRVEYKTDLPKGATAGNFNIMEIVGLSDDEKHEGLDFQQLPNDMGAIITFAQTNGYKLERIDEDGTETIVDYDNDSSSSSSI